jgi:hypothetical protein
MIAQPLPYTMGGIGDLMKHGVLAELTRWWCRRHAAPLRFLDPFGGRPWVEPPAPEVAERIAALAEFALATAQPQPSARYYGSGHVVRLAAAAAGGRAEVRASDRDPDARHDLVASGLAALEHPGFDPGDGFSILDTDIDADLVLIDPYTLCEDAAAVFPRVAALSQRMAAVLFAVIPDPGNAEGRRFAALEAKHLPEAWTLHAPRVEGESLNAFDVLLVAPRLLAQETAAELQDRLCRYARRLSGMFAAPVQLFQGAAPGRNDG